MSNSLESHGGYNNEIGLTYPDGPEGEDGISPEIIALARKIQDRAQGRSVTPYRKSLLARLQSPVQTTLPPFQYQTYRVTTGRHSHYRREDVVAIEKTNVGRAGNTVSPRETLYGPGDTFTPQSDGEALLVDQDPMKFQVIGLVADSNKEGSAELLAEINRLRAKEAEKDAQMEEMRRSLAEVQAVMKAQQTAQTEQGKQPGNGGNKR